MLKVSVVSVCVDNIHVSYSEKAIVLNISATKISKKIFLSSDYLYTVFLLRAVGPYRVQNLIEKDCLQQ